MAHYAIDHLEQILALAGCGRLLAIGGRRAADGSEITLFDAGKRKVVRKIALPTHVAALAFVSPTELVAGGTDGQLYRVNPADGATLGNVPAHAGGVTALRAADGQFLSTGVDGKVKLWRGDALSAEFATPCAQRAVAFDAANRRAAAAGDDGVIRVFALDQPAAAPREMSGHQGTVTALAFTPRDGRLASTGDDGTVRFWYLEGAVESEVRGEGDTGHAGGATGFVFLPSPAADAKDGSDRLVSTGFDAKIRTFRLDDKKRSKTFDAPGPQRAIALVESDPRKTSVEIVTGGDSRTLSFIEVGLDGRLPDSVNLGLDGFAGHAAQLRTAQRRAKELLAAELVGIPEAAALPLLDTLAGDRDTSVRSSLAQALRSRPRRDARPLLRKMVRDKDAGVAQTALAALAGAEEQPFAAYREGVRAPVAGVRVAALKALPALYPAIPLVPALIAGLLGDADRAVRFAALNALEKVFPDGVEALVTGFEKGTEDVRAEVIVRALLSGRLAQLQSISGRALDDEDRMVRQIAFTARVLERPTLGATLENMLQGMLLLPELFRRANGGKEPDAEKLAALRTALRLDVPPGELTQDDLTPLLVAMSAKASDVASMGTIGLLTATSDLRALSAMLQLSLEDDATHRLWVARVLAGLVVDPRVRQRLSSMTDDADASVRAAAAEGLAKAEDLAPLELAGILLRSAFEDMRKRGLTLLVGLPASARDGEAAALLGHALEDEAAGVRAEAFKTLWAWHDKAPEAAIDRALLGRFPDLRLSAVRQLALIAKVPQDDDQPVPKNVPAWVLERLEKAALDHDANVAAEALTAWSRLLGRDAAQPWQTGLGSDCVGTRLLAARGAARLKGRAQAESLREPLLKAMLDLSVPVKLAALESVDVLVKDDAGPLTAGLLSDALEVRVRAAELLARRGDERIIEPMRGLITDAELQLRHPAAFIEPLRVRATGALATLGSPRTAALFASPLLKDDNPGVREQAARGLCNAGQESFLLDALGHADVAVRSWAAEGLARLGDDRGLAVLTGTLQDPHLPIREGALRALAALGLPGDNALFLGLDDADDYLSDTFFAILLARDLRAAREGNEPVLLTGALSVQRPDVRYAAARALELRGDISGYTQLLIDAVSPPRPEKAGDMKDWPEEGLRERLAMQLVQLLGSEAPQSRYAAGQALLLRRKPLEFFAEVQRIVGLRSSTDDTLVPDTDQRGRASTDAVARRDWLRKLFAGAPGAKVRPAADKAVETHRWIAFGTYVGLLRLSGSDETVRRVRRDVVDRMIAMAEAGTPAPVSVVPALVRALDDDDGLVRKKALSGLTTLLKDTPDVALKHALSCACADVGLLALEQLAARGAQARPWFIEALSSNVPEVRQQAFVLLERSVGPGSLDALMAALASPHADLRLGVLNKLAASQDARVLPALRKALESERDDVRLLAAELLAQRRDDSCVPALAAFLVPDNPALPAARSALATCATEAAAAALATHLQELAALPSEGDAAARNALKRQAMEALGTTRQRTGLSALLERFDDEAPAVRAAALAAALKLANHRRPPRGKVVPPAFLKEEKRHPRWPEGVLQALRAAAKAKDPVLRLSAATELDVGTEPENDALLVALFADRDLATRVQAVQSYALRVKHHDAPLAALEQVIAQGARELMLGAAEGLAARRHPAALRPLLLFARAGEVDEQVRAVLALGVAGQLRALEELETLAAGGTEEAPVDPLVRAAAIEALGRLFPVLEDPAAKKRVVECVEAAALEGDFRVAGVRGLLGMADDRALGRLQQIVADEDDHDQAVRREAIEALASLADPSSEAVLVPVLNTALAEAALSALQACFPDDPLRVALSAATSELPQISGPALSYLLAEAEPAPLLERLAHPNLRADLRAKVKYGLGRRPSLPTETLVKYVGSEFAVVRDDMAWLMARHALAPTPPSEAEQQARARSLAAAAVDTASRWAARAGADRTAEESAYLRLVWSASLQAGQEAESLATRALAGQIAAPASVRAESARVLRRVGTAALPVLAQGATDADAAVRRAAVAVLAQAAPAQATALIDARQPLDVLTFDALKADPAMLATAAQRCVMLPKLIAAADPEALMAQAERGATEDIQRAALMALGRMGGDKVAEFLARLAFSAGPGEGGDDDEDEDEDDEDAGPSPDVSMPGSRRFELEDDDSSKFWEVVVQGELCTVRFGKIGAAGQKKPKKLATPEAAQKEADKLIREKTGKGYVEVALRGVAPPKAVPSAAGAAAGAVPDGQAWGTPALREAAFRALRRAQRTNERRSNMPTWFTEAQLDELAANPELAVAAPASRSARAAADDDEDDDDDFDDAYDDDFDDEDEDDEGEGDDDE